mmetsp:Transcript_9087/g.23940  ORF Transcript_9087/g.23940 Transcript_9087/m.23940 type:complete len:318 (+) Transcript_9087:190-1143(+)
MQSLRALTATFAAGFGGAYAYEHSDGALSSVLRSMAGWARRQDGSGRTANAGFDETADAMSELSGQVNTLSDRVTMMLRRGSEAESSRIVVVGGATSESYAKSSLSVLLSFAGTAALLAVGAYAIARARGLTFDDVAWVPKSAFQRSTQLLKASIAKLTGALAVLRDEIDARLRTLEDKVDASRSDVLSAVSSEIGRAMERIDGVSSDVNGVQRLVSSVQLQMDELTARMGYANHGIYLLCQVVAQLPESYSGAGDELRRFAALQPSSASAIMPDKKHSLPKASLTASQSSSFFLSSGLGSLLDDRVVTAASKNAQY